MSSERPAVRRSVCVAGGLQRKLCRVPTDGEKRRAIIPAGAALAQHSITLTARPPRLVSLYLSCMSRPVSRMVDGDALARCVDAHRARRRRASQEGERIPCRDGSDTGSALDHVDGEAAAAGFLVLVLHVAAGVAHGLDHLVETDAMLAVAAHGHALGVDRLDRAHRVALDTGDLHQAAD